MTKLPLRPLEGRSEGRSKPFVTSSPVLRTIFTELKARNLTQNSAAEICGVTHQSFTNWKLGRAEPSIVKMEKLAKALGYRLELVKEGEK